MTSLEGRHIVGIDSSPRGRHVSLEGCVLKVTVRPVQEYNVAARELKQSHGTDMTATKKHP
jgi:hypothetical protein